MTERYPAWDFDRYHAWAFDQHTAELQECDLNEDNVIDMVEMDPVDVDAAIEAEGWCGAYGITYGFPFVICPTGTTTMPEGGKAFIKAAIAAWHDAEADVKGETPR